MQGPEHFPIPALPVKHSCRHALHRRYGRLSRKEAAGELRGGEGWQQSPAPAPTSTGPRSSPQEAA